MTGKALKMIRALRGINERTAALAAGLSEGELARVESDEQQPSFSMILTWAKLYAVRPSTILYIGEELKAREREVSDNMEARNILMQIIERGDMHR